MVKHLWVLLLLIAISLVAGCSTTRAVGDLEVLNDVGLESTREGAKTYDRTLNTLGYGDDEPSSINSGNTNRAYYHIKTFRYTDIPNTAQDVQHIWEFVD